MESPDPDENTLEALLARLSRAFAEAHGKVPSPLFHYTSADGLVGILSTKSLWLTDLRYMNDLSELQYSRELVGSRLAHVLERQDLHPVQRDFLKRIEGNFDPFRNYNSVYSASFCENGNLLSQWRAYRGRGGGYAIGIDFFHTQRLLDKDCTLRRVTYDRDQQTRLIDSTIAEFLKWVAQASEKFGAETTAERVLPDACGAFRSAVGEFLPTFKHPDFHEEREWRLLHFANNDLRFNRDVELPRFRTFEGNVIPYFPVSFERAIMASRDDAMGIRFPFVELVIGPTINAELNRDSVTSLLLSLNPDIEPVVRQSEIPLRWL